MKEFIYKVRDDKGAPIEGKISAASSEIAVDRLHKMNYTVVSIKPVAPPLFSYELPTFGRVKTEDYVMFTTQLSAMLSSGIPLTTALEVLVDQTENPKLRAATQKVAEDIKAGASLAEAMRKHPDVFSRLFINMIAAGEVAGNLEEVLARMSSFIEKQADFQQKLFSALLYPFVLLTFGILVVILIIVTVLPDFVRIFKSAGVPLPLPTQVLYLINVFMRKYWLLIIPALVSLFFLFQIIKQTKKGKDFFDKLILVMPLWGRLARKSEIARFSRTLASLLTAGVPMLQALETCEKITNNNIFSRVIKDSHDYVKKGGSLADQLKASGEFPPMPVKMIAVGEEAGSLDKMLGKVADFYEISVDYAIKRVTSLLEPLFLVILGGIVGFILASVILPIFKMVATFQN